MSQFSVKTQESIDDFKRINERFQKNSILKEATIKSIQESCAQFSKASEETNKRLNKVFEERNHCKRDRDYLDQDINKFLMSTKPEGPTRRPYFGEAIPPRRHQTRCLIGE
ncbi:hypothetical protein O181_026098 [Austropuccinia psidii MF-1]|uniref:Uncharacterized protein n=1 Tax=Austropuccinia psidii MF-1 TaxID=1389203 RepID=A0A9Q3GZQ2_9BASI|nr:hypothetical protein [Austropuccinia psidii MF-1]